jgi:hypothetical protein
MRLRAARAALDKIALAVFVTLSAAPPGCAAGQPASRPPAREVGRGASVTVSERQTAAEAAVDRAKQRFYETLDFETVWKESYVSDEKLRRLEVEAIIFQYLDDEAGGSIGRAAKERAYLALWNYWHMIAGARFTNHPAIGSFAAEMKEPYESFTQRGKPAADERELQEHVTGKLDVLAKLLKKYVRPGEYNSQTYKAEVEKWVGRGTDPAEPERIREVFVPAGLPKDAPIYVVGREFFHYYLIEEKGEFKILTILTSRRD